MVQRLLIILTALLVTVSCSSPRKISRVGIRDPETIISENKSEIPSIRKVSSLRNKVFKMKYVSGCSRGLVDNLRQLSLDRISQPGCPTGFEGRIRSAVEKNLISGREQALFESLQEIDCRGRGLLGEFGGGATLVEAVRLFMNSGLLKIADKDSDGAKGRSVAQLEKQPLVNDLREIYSSNIPVQKHVQLNGEFVLSESDLGYLVGLVKGHCRYRSVAHFEANNAAIVSMERTEAVLSDPNLREQFKSLREKLQGVMDAEIRSFF